ncbi:MAG: tetratricopeptide repeat protein [Candidatus Krumholzibacteriota bacterium]|nr:tetratricopeptide repeat protein [Candidatus Krumholzibacteriota bacterium]
MKKLFFIILTFALLQQAPLSGGEIDGQGMLYYMKGSFFEARNDLMHAYTYYIYADRYQKDNEVILFALARVTFDMEKYDETRRYAQRMIELGKKDGEAKLILAEVEFREGNREKAVTIFEEIKDSPGVPQLEVRKFLARVYIEMKDEEKARQVLEEARAIDPSDLFTNYRLGFIYAEENEIDKAIEAFRGAIGSNPGLASAHLALGSMLLHKGEREEAKRSFNRAIELEPGNRNAIRDLADLYYEDDQIEEGISLLEPLYLEKDLDQAGKISLGRFYYRSEKYDMALAIFTNILESSGENPSILRIISEIELEKGNFRSGCSYIKRLIRLEPENFTNYIGLLLVAFDFAGEPSSPDEASDLSLEDGKRYLVEAERLHDADSAGDNYLLGTIYRKLEDYDRAGGYLLRSEQIRPDDHRTLMELAVLFQQYKKYDEAIKRISHLHEISPGDPSILNFYGYLLAEKGDRLDFAEELLSQALNSEPRNGYFLDSMGWIKYRQGDYQNALKILMEAIEIVGDDPVIWEHLGDIYSKLEMFDRARDAYTRSIDIDSEKEEVLQKLTEINETLLRVEK